jgi:FAD-linked sulfhydryl oxidase
MLQKEIFDCNKIGDFYDCGCAGDDDEDDKGKGGLAVTKHEPSENNLKTAPWEKTETSEAENGKSSQEGKEFNKDTFHRVEITSEP